MMSMPSQFCPLPWVPCCKNRSEKGENDPNCEKQETSGSDMGAAATGGPATTSQGGDYTPLFVHFDVTCWDALDTRDRKRAPAKAST